jgi:L-amino acid N-acyltransferase YncA
VYAIRDGRPEDARNLEAFDRQFTGTHAAELFESAIAGGKVTVVEAEEGAVVGYVRWEYFWDTIPLCLTVRVHPDHRRRGLGRGLYQHVDNVFRREGREFWLSSTEETNDISKRFHEALGFRRIGALESLGQDVPEVFYRKDAR